MANPTIQFQGTLAYEGPSLPYTERFIGAGQPIDDEITIQWSTDPAHPENGSILTSNGIGAYPVPNGGLPPVASYGATLMEPGMYCLEFRFEPAAVLTGMDPGDQLVPYFTICNTLSKQPIAVNGTVVGPTTTIGADNAQIDISFTTTQRMVPPRGGLTVVCVLAARVVDGAVLLDANPGGAFFSVTRVTGVGQQLLGVYT